MRYLAVLPINRHRFHAFFPSSQQQMLYVFCGGGFWQVHRLGNASAQKRLDGCHHVYVPVRTDGVFAERASKHFVMFGPDVGSVAYRVVLTDVLRYLVYLFFAVAEGTKRTGHGLVDDGHRSAAHELLGFDQRKVGLYACGVAVHHEADRACGGQHRDLRIAHADFLG